jgi:hypothetical protein
LQAVGPEARLLEPIVKFKENCKMRKHVRTLTITIAVLASTPVVLPSTASATCNKCTIDVPDGSLPARAYGEAVGGAVGGMVGGAVGSAVGGAVGTAAGGVAGGVGGGIVGGAAGTAMGDHAGTFYGGAAGGLIDRVNGGK